MKVENCFVVTRDFGAGITLVKVLTPNSGTQEFGRETIGCAYEILGVFTEESEAMEMASDLRSPRS